MYERQSGGAVRRVDERDRQQRVVGGAVMAAIGGRRPAT
jgi:hypothetical protein